MEILEEICAPDDKTRFVSGALPQPVRHLSLACHSSVMEKPMQCMGQRFSDLPSPVERAPALRPHSVSATGPVPGDLCLSICAFKLDSPIQVSYQGQTGTRHYNDVNG